MERGGNACWLFKTGEESEQELSPLGIGIRRSCLIWLKELSDLLREFLNKPPGVKMNEVRITLRLSQAVDDYVSG